ncbi:hypothetical protein LOK49_LG10G01617 [Camellia lanceoleosa]|uniref:Uncharacterized protein n=1 Tax=Camellia lanceoleosa TaxID=1840588 RepID=A0ACC0GA39_9ERIC|nr:hypothetical protein LOK49_LG10G01617 [Camellia lanceoleosa]
MKLIGEAAQHKRKKDGSNSNSARTSPSKLEDSEFVNNSLLATMTGDFDDHGILCDSAPSLFSHYIHCVALNSSASLAWFFSNLVLRLENSFRFFSIQCQEGVGSGGWFGASMGLLRIIKVGQKLKEQWAMSFGRLFWSAVGLHLPVICSWLQVVGLHLHPPLEVFCLCVS